MGSSSAVLRRARHREADRATLLSAAEAAFARRGFEGTSMREIAADAGFSVGGVYQFFPSKEELYVAVVDAVAAAYQTAIADALASGTFLERLRALTQATQEFLLARRAFLSLHLGVREDLTSELRDRVQRVVDAHRHVRRRQVVALMDEGLREGHFHTGDAEFLATAYHALLVKTLMPHACGIESALPSTEWLLSFFLHGACGPAA
jgi:AcrR family transcriptional regulator